jgi:type IV secretion system protein TrbL
MVGFGLLLGLLMTPSAAMAGTSVGLSTVMQAFQSTTQGWYNSIFQDALDLFGALFAIEISWLAVTWMIGGKDVHDIFSSLIKKLLSIGFFFTVLEYAGRWVPWMIGGFKTVAVTAGGEPITTVSDIAMTGLKAFVICIEGGPTAAAKDGASLLSDIWNGNYSGAVSAVSKATSAVLGTVTGVDFLVGAVVGFILILSFTYVVLEVVAVQLEGMIVLSAGVIMLGFGGARWTTKFVESYMQYTVSVGVRLMILTLWASFIEWQINPLIKTTLINGNASMTSYGVVLILALLAAWLTKKLPGFANSILSGQSTLSGGELYGAVKGAAIAAAAVVTGGAALAGGAAGAAVTMGAGEAAGGGAMTAAETSGAGAMGASGGVLAPAASAPAESGVAQPGVSAPGASPAGSTIGQSGTQAAPTSGGSTTAGSSAGQSGTTTAPQASTPDSGQSGTTPQVSSVPGTGSSAGQSGGSVAPTSTPTGDSGSPVDHRPAAPNAPATGGGTGSGGVPAPEAPPSALDRAKQAYKSTSDALHSGHDAVNIGKPSNTGVSAPGLGIKHLSD